MRRYVVRRKEDWQYSIWDTDADKPAEADGRRYVDLQFEEALDFADLLNGARRA